METKKIMGLRVFNSPQVYTESLKVNVNEKNENKRFHLFFERVLCFSANSTIFCWTASPLRRRTLSM